MKVCGRCGKSYNEHPAISRKGYDEICPLCGNEEALDALIDEGLLDEEGKKEILNSIKEGMKYD